ncbi:hypothetical protein BJX70DRAFT_249511 [Aspergillus crustosus]
MGNRQSSNRRSEEVLPEWQRSIHKHYDGTKHWASGVRSRRPQLSPEQLEDRVLELDALHGEDTQRERPRQYLNVWGDDEHEKFTDLDVYYSSTKEFARRLVVQATETAMKDTRPRHWNHRRVTGNPPLVIRLTELCLNPFDLDKFDGSSVVDGKQAERGENKRNKKSLPRRVLSILVLKPLHWILSAVLTLLLGWIIQVLLSVEVVTAPWTENSAVESYLEYQNVDWEWPKHAVNILDQSPKNKNPQSILTNITIPKRLVVKAENGEWQVTDTKDLRSQETGMLEPYVLLSFKRASYFKRIPDKEELRLFFRSVAESVLREENATRNPKEPPIKAFWVDTDCVSQSPPEEWIQDVNTICDAVRCATRVYILLPSDNDPDKKTWGERIWTLPEALLAAEKLRYWVTVPGNTHGDILSPPKNLLLTDMYKSFWADRDTRLESAISHLIDHYTNRTTLSELQMFTFAVQALARLSMGTDIKGYEANAMAYAAMGLMSYRLTPIKNDTVFQTIARLSLVNDSNQLVERLLCLSPKPGDQPPPPRPNENGEYTENFANNAELLCNVAEKDQYCTQLWDIHPLCNVVGIGDDQATPTVIMDRCRGIPIRWTSFPRLKYASNMDGFRATISQWIVYLGAWFFASGFNQFQTVVTLAFSTTAPRNSTNTTVSSDSESVQTQQVIAFDRANLEYAMFSILVFIVIGWIISWFSPRAVRELCNNGTRGVSSHLVGIEGTLPLKDIEVALYGNYHDRLSYAPSTTPFCWHRLRHPRFRQGQNVDPGYWEEMRQKLGVPDTHRLFTIVDTGDLSVSVIAAERPPVVALICGREGGMLRAVLCSWRFESNTLYRETVMRMRSSLEEVSRPNDWLKISLASQGDVTRMRRHIKRSKGPIVNGHT